MALNALANHFYSCFQNIVWHIHIFNPLIAEKTQAKHILTVNDTVYEHTENILKGT